MNLAPRKAIFALTLEVREKRKGKAVEGKQHAKKTKINFLLCSTYLKFANVVF